MESIVMGTILLVASFLVIGLVAACAKVIASIIGGEGVIWIGSAAIIFTIFVMMS